MTRSCAHLATVVGCSDIYRYDHGTQQVTLPHNPWHDVAALTFLPGDPSVMYLGLSIEP